MHTFTIIKITIFFFRKIFLEILNRKNEIKWLREKSNKQKEKKGTTENGQGIIEGLLSEGLNMFRQVKG